MKEQTKLLENGHVHKTYIVYDAGGKPDYVLQQINTVAFKNPDLLMENVLKVSSYLNSHGQAAPEFIPFEDGKYLKKNYDGIWRKMKYIDALSFDQTDNLKLIKGCGKAFGSFAEAMNGFDYPLAETIPDFHNTKERLNDCLLSADRDICSRRKNENAEKLICLLEKNYDRICSDYSALLSSAPLRITHNDTKISNVMFDRNTSEPKAVIDLDNVMYGMTLYDFGDGARAISLEQINGHTVFNKEKYECFKNAFLSRCTVLSSDEKANLMRAVRTISTELGARFLEDYLNGDIYFNTNYENHNLVRATNLLSWSLETE